MSAFRAFFIATATVVMIGIGACSDNRYGENSAAKQSTEREVADHGVQSRAKAEAEEILQAVEAVRVEKQGNVAAQPAASAASAADRLASVPPAWMSYPEQNRENYDAFSDNPVKQVARDPVSTFSVDVDTGSYSNVRRFLQNGQTPPADAVRVEELLNYFDYGYAPAQSESEPFSINTQLMPSPWNPNTSLLRIGLRGFDVERDELPASNLVFLVDVSGSMKNRDKLPLLKKSLGLLTNKMREQDRIAVVVYAGGSSVALESTGGDEKRKIRRAVERLSAGGSTNGAAGIELAYSIAADNFIEAGINRVILATDGDFNVGTVDFSSLIDMIEERRESGISLTTLGFGMGNFNDHLMEQLADAGNGNYAYIDTISEANKVLIEEMSSTLHTIASDVKIQIEFNPNLVAEYRLIGYENRSLRREDFNNDKIDAGELGAGHTVTALYEIALSGSGGERVEPLRYRQQPEIKQQPKDEKGYSDSEVAHIRLRFKQPGESSSQRLERIVSVEERVDSLADVDDDSRFSAAVAAFGQLLRGGEYTGNFGFDDTLKLAKQGRGTDDSGYRAEFLRLVALSEGLQPLNVSNNENAQ